MIWHFIFRISCLTLYLPVGLSILVSILKLVVQNDLLLHLDVVVVSSPAVALGSTLNCALTPLVGVK